MSMKKGYRYLIAAILTILAVITAYMTGCSDVYFSSGVSVDCNSFAINFGTGECNYVELPPEEEGIEIPEEVKGRPGSGGQQPGQSPGGQGFIPVPEDCDKFDVLSKPAGCKFVEQRPSGRLGEDPRGQREKESEPGYNKFEYEVIAGKVVIIFVIDNSSSMHEEHENLASQARQFLRGMKDIPYHIAIITTDISSSPGNPVRGAVYQDGNFIPFALSGRKWLENKRLGEDPDPYDVEDFQKTIVRPETEECDEDDDDFERDCFREVELERFRSVEECEEVQRQGSGTCPSHDERAIYALNLAIPKHRDFFDAPNAHAMFVIVSDEDNRSGEEYIKTGDTEGIDYSFESNDEPETLIETVYSLHNMQTFSVHSVIIKPGDTKCLREQNEKGDGGAGTGRGYYGEVYAELSMAKKSKLQRRGNLLRGSIISICDRNFGSQLARLNMYSQIPRMPITCSNPAWIGIKVNGKKANHLKPRFNGRVLEFDDQEVPIGSKVSATVYCPA